MERAKLKSELDNLQRLVDRIPPDILAELKRQQRHYGKGKVIDISRNFRRPCAALYLEKLNMEDTGWQKAKAILLHPGQGRSYKQERHAVFVCGNNRIKISEHFAAGGKPLGDLIVDVVRHTAEKAAST